MFGIKQDGTYRVERIGFSDADLSVGYVVAIRPIKREADIVTEGALFGRWTDDDGTVYWDAVEVITDRAAALAAAARRSERAIWDAEHGEAVTVYYGDPDAECETCGRDDVVTPAFDAPRCYRHVSHR